MRFDPNFQSGLNSRVSGAQQVTFDAGLRAYMLRVYNWMASGLALTGIVAWLVASNPSVMSLFYNFNSMGQVAPTGLGLIAMLSPLAFVMAISFGINKLSLSTAQTLFWVYCAVMGISLSNIFLIYAGESIVRVFFVSAATFAAMSLWGYTTERSLLKLGSFLLMGLIGLVIASLVNMFMASSGLQFVLSVAGVLIFTLLTAYDTQMIKYEYGMLANQHNSGDMLSRRSVVSALSLYLNFINIFLLLLRLFGERR